LARIAIIGLGLIGGSLGLAIKRAQLRDVEIVGFARSRETREKAKRAGAIDRAAPGPDDAARGANIVIIATPIGAIPDTFERIAPVLSENALVTDAASTKNQVMRWARDLLPPSVDFVGGHPMAGKETTGIDVAEATLFEGKPYCIVPSVHAQESAVHTVVGLARLVGATPVFLDAEEHDSYVAAISHLPLVVSTALFSLVRDSAAWPEISHLASSGFRDVTRLASGSPAMSEDICHTNADNIVHWLDRMIAEIRKYRDFVRAADEEALYEVFARIKQERDEFLSSGPKPRPTEKPAEAAISFSDLLMGRWAAERTREIMKAVEEQEQPHRNGQPHRPKRER
jgi:prephenate dehydrogenase